MIFFTTKQEILVYGMFPSELKNFFAAAKEKLLKKL